MKSLKKDIVNLDNTETFRVHNHLESNWNLSNKKALFYNMKAYYEVLKENPFDYIPLTFHIQHGIEDKEFLKFQEYYNQRNEEVKEYDKIRQESKYDKRKFRKIKNIWIIKPGEITNRGIGITVCGELSEIKQILSSAEIHPNGKHKTYIVQQYIENPFLYKRRKFDLRCYVLITNVNGIMKGYWY